MNAHDDAAPEVREIMRETATDLEFDEHTGMMIPSNDGKDRAGWEYENMQTVDGRVFRVPLRRR